jgi:hypothetical protein
MLALISRTELTSWFPFTDRCVENGIVVWNELFGCFSRYQELEAVETHNADSKRTKYEKQNQTDKYGAECFRPL